MTAVAELRLTPYRCRLERAAAKTQRSPGGMWMKVGPDTIVGANQDFNLQTPAPALRAGTNPYRGQEIPKLLGDLPPGLHSTGGSVGWIETQRVVIQS